MKKRPILIITLLAVTLPTLILIGAASASQRGACMDFGGKRDHSAAIGKMPFGRHMKGMFRMMDTLDLSKEQREKIWSIMDERRTQMRAHMASMYEGRKELHEVAVEGAYDEAKVRSLADAQGKAMADLIVLRTQMRGQIKSLLTPEQQEKLVELRTQRRGGFLAH